MWGLELLPPFCSSNGWIQRSKEKGFWMILLNHWTSSVAYLTSKFPVISNNKFPSWGKYLEVNFFNMYSNLFTQLCKRMTIEIPLLSNALFLKITGKFKRKKKLVARELPPCPELDLCSFHHYCLWHRAMNHRLTFSHQSPESCFLYFHQSNIH